MSGIIMHDFDVGIAIPERQRLAAVVARALMNAGGFGPCGLIFVDGLIRTRRNNQTGGDLHEPVCGWPFSVIKSC